MPCLSCDSFSQLDQKSDHTNRITTKLEKETWARHALYPLISPPSSPESRSTPWLPYPATSSPSLCQQCQSSSFPKITLVLFVLFLVRFVSAPKVHFAEKENFQAQIKLPGLVLLVIDLLINPRRTFELLPRRIAGKRKNDRRAKRPQAKLTPSGQLELQLHLWFPRLCISACMH